MSRWASANVQNLHIGGSAKPVGFYGQNGIKRASLTESDGG